MIQSEPLVPLTDDQRNNFLWLNEPHIEKVVQALYAAKPFSVRFVGGCVRDSLLGQDPKDIDAATILQPDAVMHALESAGITCVPTGIAYGTITAIIDHKAIEITTLRTDVETDGRHATVEYTDDWMHDAVRRDFTINAIYLTPEGAMFDPVGGLGDLKKKKVKFIGDPQDRIKEDFLRILRFFRFSARFCTEFDAPGLAACAKLRAGISTLSAERVGDEFSAILRLPNAGMAVRKMVSTDVLSEIWQTDPNISAIENLKNLEPNSPVPLVLAALFGDKGNGIDKRLRHSNAERAIRENALRAVRLVSSSLTDQTLLEYSYCLGKDVLADGVLLAASKCEITSAEFDQFMQSIARITVPVFAISGKHVVSAGVPAGPAVSKILKAVEKRWIEEGFPDEQRQHALLMSALSGEP
ncbi:CCA tRNA nucleotidyltransferase [Hyphococcus lacteus]|uniref:CCA tRNA nucleotidyltransferase n=1 Tax=Hyphococcus lacteus TaxID=3143536 RepID=A0ABV3Z3A7_9PROT